MEPIERAIMEFMERTGTVSPALFCLVHAMSGKCRLFGWPLPMPEEVRLDGLVPFRKKTALAQPITDVAARPEVGGPQLELPLT